MIRLIFHFVFLFFSLSGRPMISVLCPVTNLETHPVDTEIKTTTKLFTVESPSEFPSCKNIPSKNQFVRADKYFAIIDCAKSQN